MTITPTMLAVSDQAQHIATIIDCAEDGESLREAYDLLSFAEGLWEALGCAGNVMAVRSHLSEKASSLAVKEKEYIAGCRKNDRTLSASKKNLRKLESLVLV